MAELLWRCNECDWRGPESKLLMGENPFNKALSVMGCPQCFEIGQFVNVCDEPHCDQDATCGWGSADDYRRTCFKHSVWGNDR